jgi:hypothetical protein
MSSSYPPLFCHYLSLSVLIHLKSCLLAFLLALSPDTFTRAHPRECEQLFSPFAFPCLAPRLQSKAKPVANHANAHPIFAWSCSTFAPGLRPAFPPQHWRKDRHHQEPYTRQTLSPLRIRIPAYDAHGDSDDFLYQFSYWCEVVDAVSKPAANVPGRHQPQAFSQALVEQFQCACLDLAQMRFDLGPAWLQRVQIR